MHMIIKMSASTSSENCIISCLNVSLESKSLMCDVTEQIAKRMESLLNNLQSFLRRSYAERSELSNFAEKRKKQVTGKKAQLN